MSAFKTELEISCDPKNDGIWILDADLVYDSDLMGATIKVPKGFFTDLASVPRVPIIYELWGNRAHREAVIHDYLYRADSEPFATFMQANRVFREAMIVRGKPFWIRAFMFAGVCFGWQQYHQKLVSWKPD